MEKEKDENFRLQLVVVLGFFPSSQFCFLCVAGFLLFFFLFNFGFGFVFWFDRRKGTLRSKRVKKK